MADTADLNRAWHLHDSGAFGVEFVAVRVVSVGAKRQWATVERGGRRARVRLGELQMVKGSAPEWAEDFDAA